MITTIANTLIALCSLAALLVNVVLIKLDRKNRAEESWHKTRNSRKKFWETCRKAYTKYHTENPTLPHDFQELINRAGMPPNAPGDPKNGTIAWESMNKKKLSDEQSHIYAFAQSVYPERKKGAFSHREESVLSEDDFDILDEARRELDGFFMIWGKRLKMKKFIQTYRHGVDDCMILCWFDLALIRWTHDEGIGDPTIYRLGYAYTKANNKGSIER